MHIEKLGLIGDFTWSSKSADWHGREMTHEITTFGARRQSRLIAVVNVLDTEVCDFQHPAAVDDAVARLEVAVNFHWTQMQISHTLQNVQKNFDMSVSIIVTKVDWTKAENLYENVGQLNTALELLSWENCIYYWLVLLFTFYRVSRKKWAP